MRAAVVFAFIASTAAAQDIVYTDTTSRVETNGDMTTTVKSPPASAISPQISNSNSDLCTVGVAGAVQTQILGISAGKTVRYMNCGKLKNAKTLYDMGMKVAAVSTMCQDPLVFDAMMNAGTPCPYQGLIGEAAKLGWETHVDETKKELKEMGPIDAEKAAPLIGGGLLALLLLL